MCHLEQSHVSVKTEAPWGSSPVPVCLLARCAASVLNSLIVNISTVGFNISTDGVNTSAADVNISTLSVNISTAGVNISTFVVNIISVGDRIVDTGSTAWLLQLPVQDGVDQVGVVLIVEVELQYVHYVTIMLMFNQSLPNLLIADPSSTKTWVSKVSFT